MNKTVLPEDVRKVTFEVEMDGDFNSIIAGIALLDGVKNVKDVTEELASTREQAKEAERERFKMEVVKYALDELKKDLYHGGISDKEKEIISRLKYWILETETTQR